MRTLLSLAATILAMSPAFAQVAGQTGADPAGVDLSKLTAPQRDAALKMMQELGCPCGCSMKVAQCRIEDPNCGYSGGLAQLIVTSFADGKSAEEVAKIVAASPLAKERPHSKILEDPVQIPVAGAPQLGPATAAVTLVEFSDFECPYCALATTQLQHILAAYPSDVRLIYKQFPLATHPHAELAARASLAAADQGRFWELHDKMFANFRIVTRDNILAWARDLGLDMPKFSAALESPRNRAIVQKDLEDGEKAGVEGTPSIFINGKHFNGPVDLATLKPYLEDEMKLARQGEKR